MITIEDSDLKPTWFSGALEAFSEFVELFEFRALRRIFAVWGAMFCVGALSLARSYGEFRELFFITICCLGLVMSATWTCLYGEFRWQRFAKYLLLIAVVSWIGALLTGEAFGGEGGQMTLLATFTGFIAIAPIYGTRRGLGWRILHAKDLPSDWAASDQSKQFSISDAMIWTTFWAVIFVVSKLIVSYVFRDRASNFFSFLFLGVLSPCAIGLIYFALVGRLSLRRVSIAVPIISFTFAIAFCLFAVWDNAYTGDVMRYVFWPVLIWFSIAGWVLNLVIFHLQRRGFVFAFGGHQEIPSAEALRELELESLQKRLVNTQWLRLKTQRLQLFIDQCFVNRLESLNTKLTKLRKATLNEASSEDSK